MKKILILSSSARVKGNSVMLADEFMRGAQDAGLEVEKIQLSRANIKGCLGCNACQRNGGDCVQRDDAIDIIGKMMAADVVVFASPVYFYNVNAQMKLLLDRTYCKISLWKDKETYLLTTGAAGEEHYFDNIVQSFKHYIGCFENVALSGVVLGKGTMERGDVKATPAMQQAYDMGKNVELHQ